MTRRVSGKAKILSAVFAVLDAVIIIIIDLAHYHEDSVAVGTVIITEVFLIGLLSTVRRRK